MTSTGPALPSSHVERRCVTPETTIDNVRPYFERLGITRVASITGLDRLGMPVWQAIRPNARGLCVSQGKGVTDAEARASAVMEATELHHAEFSELEVRLEAYEDLCRTAAVVDPELLPRARQRELSSTTAIPWVEARPVGGGEPVWLPFELVHTNFLHPPPFPGSGFFTASANGLASGNTPAEAALHGLCEVVERDARTLWSLRQGRLVSTRIDLATVEDPIAHDLLARCDDAGFDVAAWDMTSDVRVPVIRVLLFDRHADELLYPVLPGDGAGCHVRRDVALLRALTEAAQSRLTFIAGAREDMPPGTYGTLDARLVNSHRAVAAMDGTVALTGLPDHVASSTEGELAIVLEQLDRVQLPRPVMVDLSRTGWPVFVVRVQGPGLEGPSRLPSYRPGRRAVARGAKA